MAAADVDFGEKAYKFFTLSVFPDVTSIGNLKYFTHFSISTSYSAFPVIKRQFLSDKI